MKYSNEQNYYGFYRAVVIQNNDPDRSGRVKVFIPQFAAHFARQANLTEGELKLSFVGGKNIDTFLKGDVLKKFKSAMHWIEQASPLMGSGTAGLYDAKNDRSTVSDAYRGQEFDEVSAGSLSLSGEPVKVSSVHNSNPLYAGHGVGAVTGKANIDNNRLRPCGITNAAKGSFSIPRVGSWVWIFFEDGSIDKPVYFSYSFGKEDWNSVLDPNPNNPSLHYPAGSENEEDSSAHLHTGHNVLNYKAGTLEFIDTDDLETVRLTHTGGSYISMQNNSYQDVCTSTKTINTVKDEFHTVGGDYILTVKGDVHLQHRGDIHETYGTLENKELYNNWVESSKAAFAQAELFPNDVTTVTDPTINGVQSKPNGPNATFHFPKKLALAYDKSKEFFNDLFSSTDPTGKINNETANRLNQLRKLNPQKYIDDQIEQAKKQSSDAAMVYVNKIRGDSFDNYSKIIQHDALGVTRKTTEV